jgi:long-subunit fatty acid transport protein
MKKILFLLFLVVAIGKFSHAQDEKKNDPDNYREKKGFDKSKLFIGGNFGMTFGDYTLINVSPQLGYRFNEYLAAGAGINFQYISLKERDFYGNPVDRISQEVIGMNIFGRVYPIRQLMLQAQPELNYVFGKIKYYNPPSRTNLDASIVPSLLLGGGVVFPGGNGAFIISVFYDVLQNSNSPYSDKPFFSFGYNVGF